jgi:hypothetical protein
MSSRFPRPGSPVVAATIPSLLLGLACAVTEPSTPPSDVLVLDGLPTCQDCAITLREVAVLGSAGDPASVSADAMLFPCGVAEFSGRGFLSARLVGAGELGVYDRGGSFLGSVGKPGRGPGELGRDLRILAGDSSGIWVLDNGNQRVVRFDSEGGWVDGFPLPDRVYSHAMIASGGLLLHTRPGRVEESADRLFRLVGPAGGDLARFGLPDPALGELDQHVVSAARDGGFYTARIWDYELRKWAAPDSLVWRLRREVDWFPDPEFGPGFLEGLHTERPAPPVLVHVGESSDGLLWVYSMVADEDWRPGPPERPTPEWTARVFDTMVEVIDPETPGVVAAGRFDEVFAPMCGSDRVYTVRRIEGGDTRAVILQPQLRGGGGR